MIFFPFPPRSCWVQGTVAAWGSCHHLSFQFQKAHLWGAPLLLGFVVYFIVQGVLFLMCPSAKTAMGCMQNRRRRAVETAGKSMMVTFILGRRSWLFKLEVSGWTRCWSIWAEVSEVARTWSYWDRKIRYESRLRYMRSEESGRSIKLGAWFVCNLNAC